MKISQHLMRQVISSRRTSSGLVARGFVLCGPPGGGKGTIAKRLEKHYKLPVLGTGDIIRQHIRDGTELGKKVEETVRTGGLIPDQLCIKDIVDLVKLTLDSMKDQSYILDGVPRTVQQALSLEQSHPPIAALNIDVPFDTIIERLKERLYHPGSGRIYNFSFNPPKTPGIDDITGEELITRPDDQPATVRARLTEYEKSTEPVLDFYKQKMKLYTFSGTQTDEIYPMIQLFLQETYHMRPHCVD